MTPEQLEHLRAIDAHLANLLAIAEKRTPGEWYSHPETLDSGRLFNTINAKESFVLHVCSTKFVHEDAAFIATCAGNAEAGWKATRASIVSIRLTVPPHCPQSLLRENDEVRTAYNLMTDILAAFPLELVKP